MASKSSQFGLRAAQVAAVTLSLGILAWLVKDAQERHNPAAGGPANSEGPAQTGPNGLTAAGPAASTPQGDPEGDNKVFLPTSKSLVVDPAFLPTSKSMVMDIVTSGEEAEAFPFSSKSAVIPEWPVRSNTLPPGTKPTPAFLPSSKSEVPRWPDIGPKSSGMTEALVPEIWVPPATVPSPVFLPSSKWGAPQVSSPNTPRVRTVRSTSKANASSKSGSKKGQSKKKPDPKR